MDHSWLSKPGAETGAFVLALPFSYDPATMADFRKAADDMLAWATDNFDYPTYVIADDGAADVAQTCAIFTPKSHAFRSARQPNARNFAFVLRAARSISISNSTRSAPPKSCRDSSRKHAGAIHLWVEVGDRRVTHTRRTRRNRASVDAS